MKIKHFFFCLILFIQTVKAQDSLRFLSATTGAGCYRVEYYNDFLFAGTGTTLRVYDASGIPPFQMLFEHRFRSIILDLKVKNNFLYVAANHDGISKWDITSPSNPLKLYEYVPDSLNEAAYHISFYGDTIFVAYFKKVGVFYDNGISFQKISTFGHITGNGYIAGGDLKNNVYAYTVGRNGYTGAAPDGVYFRNAQTFAPISFYQQTFAAPEGVIFGKNTSLIHVLGGTQNTYNPFDARGLFYSLDISNINSPQVAFSDTITDVVLGLAVASPQNAVNINDTIYVATNAALETGWTLLTPAYGQVYVYDATNISNVNLLTNIYAGLWHFDAEVHNQNMFVASEWYGIKTLNISDIYNEVDLGNTLTGGWALKGDKFGNTMILANEGYGIKKFDITDPFQPVLTGSATFVSDTIGFCQNVKFSANGNYIYGLFQTVYQFRIYDKNTLSLVGKIPNIGGVSYGNTDMQVWGNKIFFNGNIGGNDSIQVMDVTNPASPFIVSKLPLKENDMKMSTNGKLFICNNDGIFVYDVTGTPALLASHLFSGIQDGKKIAVVNDTIFAYVTWKGLVSYIYNSTLNTITENTTVSLGSLGTPQAMAADQFGLYIGYTKFGLYAYNKQTMAQTNWYRTGLDLKGYTDIWPLTDLYCKDNLIFLNEYFGQTSILTMDNSILTTAENSISSDSSPELIIYPNPSNGNFVLQQIKTGDKKPLQNGNVEIYDVYGQKVFQSQINSTKYEIHLDLPGGIYFYKFKEKEKITGTGKIILQ